MKVDIIVWNCQGTGNLKFHRVLREYIREFKPSIIVLIETRVSGLIVECVIKKVEMPYSYHVEACGFFRGI